LSHEARSNDEREERSFALKALTAANEKRIAALVKRAVS
jgi:hypothetical protein